MVGLPPLTIERQRARRTALDRIGRHLDALGEPSWFGVVADWLGHYAGLELYLWPEDDPVLQVLGVVQRHVEHEQMLHPEEFAGELAELGFVGMAARRDTDGARWDPLTDRFDAWTQGELVSVWETFEPGAVRDMTQTRLVVRFTKAHTPDS